MYSSIQYDMLGNVVKPIDAKGNVSTINYNDNFGTPNGEARTNSAPAQLNGQQTFAFPTSATNPAGWTTYAQFDYFTGAGVDAEDLNGNVNSTIYNDPLDRPTQTIVANNTSLKSQATIVYDDANHRIQTTGDLFTFGDNLAKSESFYDGLGRTFQSRKYEETGSYVATVTKYDALGRVKRGTNPYRPGQNEPQLWTTTTYDALSRPISVTTPDGATVTTAYSGNAVTVTDQAGKQRRSISNGLGQLVRVDEPDDAGNLGSVSSPVQPTFYEYSTLGKMVKVTQGVQARFFLYDSLGRLLRVRQPEQAPNSNLNLSDGVTGNSQWTAGFTYDANGNLLTALDAKGVLITSTYDNINRAVTRTYSDGTPSVTYSYDNLPNAKGKLTQVQNSVSTSQALAFDNLGRTLASRQITDGVNYDSSYLYNLSGALVEETYPSGRKVKNTFETDGDLSKVETNIGGGAYQVRAQNLGYTASGVLEKLQIGNGLWETAQLNSRLQVTQLGLGTSPTDASIWKLNYDFGNNTNNDGNIKSQTLTTPNAVYTQTFQYDSLDRLKQATETTGGNQTWIQNFAYDRYGNRTGFNQTINGQTTNGTPAVDVNTNRFNAGQGYVYDLAGNVVQDPQNRQFIFNGDNKQVQVKDASQNVIGTYYYDGDGKRIKKVTNQESTTFVYSGGKLVAEYTMTNATPTSPQTQYLGTDMLQSPRILTDQNGQVISRRDFMPFGEDIPNFGARTQANGYKPDNLRQKFTGYQKDNETGLDFAEARYYNNTVGRFTAVDPLMASGKSANPQTFNRYAYVMNSPLVLSDPSGLQAGNPVKAPPPVAPPQPPVNPVPAPQPAPIELAPVALESAEDAAGQAARNQIARTAASTIGNFAGRAVMFTLGAPLMILTMPTTIQAPAPLTMPETEPEEEERRPGGTATIGLYPKGFVIDGEPLTHQHTIITVVTDQGGQLTTHQVRTSDGTTIANGGDLPEPPITLKVRLPNALNAINYQNTEIGKPGPAYEPNTNSCVHHVGDVLRAGGLSIPNGTTRELRRIISKLDKLE